MHSTLNVVVTIAGLTLISGLAHAGNLPIQNVPALDSWGLIGISAALGILGLIALKKRK